MMSPNQLISAFSNDQSIRIYSIDCQAYVQVSCSFLPLVFFFFFFFSNYVFQNFDVDFEISFMSRNNLIADKCRHTQSFGNTEVSCLK